MTDWIARWKNGEIGWHKDRVNARLIAFIDCLELQQGDLVFVPLCGKSQDMMYLLECGFRVIGVELSALAIEQFFDENQLNYSKHQSGQFKVYQAENISLYCGDYFALNKMLLSAVSAVYDRAALVALDGDLRTKYAIHLYAIIPNGCRILLLTLNYPQTQISGPPYAVNAKEVRLLFTKFEYRQLECFNDIDNEPKFQNEGVDFIEKVTYCLHKK